MLCMIGTTGRARAEDCTTNTIVRVVTNVAGEVMVGDTGRSNALIVAAGGVLYSASGKIGNSNTASWNLALVTGVGSAWYITNNLTIGYQGSNNCLVIANGGTVSNAIGQISWSAVPNGALVTDPGSKWVALSVCIEGDGSWLVVTNGGALETLGARIGDYTPNNTVTISGQGSKWQNAQSLRLGSAGMSNTLNILDGAVFTNGTAFLGGDDIGAGRFNRAIVAGQGSRWINSGNLTVGWHWQNNTVLISNGGYMENAEGVHWDEPDGAQQYSCRVGCGCMLAKPEQSLRG